MGIKILALALGMAEDAPEDQVFTKAAEFVKGSVEAKKKLEKLSTDHSALVAEVEKQGYTVEGAKLSKIEPLKLDILESDDDEKKALKAELAKNRLRDQVAVAKSQQDIVTQLSKDLVLPPALKNIADEVFGVKGEIESMMLSKDGMNIELKKTANFPQKLETLIRGIVNLKGSKLKAAGAGEKVVEELDKKKGEEQVKAAVELAQPSEGSEDKE